MNIYTIYKATNLINGKSYIGIDSYWPNRMSQHKTAVKKKSQFYFHKALRKYGFDQFKWEVLYTSKDHEFCCKIMESYMIKKYNTFENGYNMTSGGEGIVGFEHSDKTKQKMSIASKGKPKSLEHRKALSEAKLKNPSRFWLGKKRSIETIEKIQKTKKIKKQLIGEIV